MDTPIEHLREICEANGIEWQPNWGVGKLVFELYDELGEATIIDPTFVCDYPEEVSPLSKRKDEDNRLTDRFELVISGHGCADGKGALDARHLDTRDWWTCFVRGIVGKTRCAATYSF